MDGDLADTPCDLAGVVGGRVAGFVVAGLLVLVWGTAVTLVLGLVATGATALGLALAGTDLADAALEAGLAVTGSGVLLALLCVATAGLATLAATLADAFLGVVKTCLLAMSKGRL